MKFCRVILIGIFFTFSAKAVEDELYTKVDEVHSLKVNSRSTFYSNSFRKYFSDYSNYKVSLIDENITFKAERFLGFWVNDFKKNMICTSTEYNKHKDYLRYVYRLLYISLMAQSLEEYSLYLRKFNGEKVDPVNELKGCRPNSQDMKKFVARLNKYDFSKRSRLIGELLPSEKVKELERIKKNQSPFLNHFICSGPSCTEKLLIKKLKENIQKISREIKDSCETNLPLQKLSQKKILLSLIYDSPALNIFENDSLKNTCLQKLNEREFQSQGKGELESVLSQILSFKQVNRYSDIVGNNPLGNLFNFGALRYFDNLGLGDLIFEEVKVASIKKPIEIKQIIKVIKKKKISKNIIKKIKKIEQKTKKIEAKKYELSAIEKAVLYFQVKNKSINVDMDKFSLDYPKMKKEFIKIQKPLKKFQTRKSLNIMKRIDKLGEKRQPFPLKFLKFLIDFDFHQGLYNILAEIGDEFYLLNDVEGKKTPFRIQLKNDESTNYKWNIKVIGL